MDESQSRVSTVVEKKIDRIEADEEKERLRKEERG